MRKWVCSKKFLFFVITVLFCSGAYLKLSKLEVTINEMSASKNPFSPANITNELESDPVIDVNASPELLAYVNVITQQPFYWLSKGFQAYAFESQDGEYVIKFFQMKRLAPASFWDHPIEYVFSNKFRRRMQDIIEHKKEILTSSKLVFEEAPEETGVIFVHMNKTDKLLHGVRIFDLTNQSYKIKPDTCCFLIQRKAKYVIPTLNELMKNDDLAGAQARINQIFTLLFTLAKKRLVDSDYALIRNNNIGFLSDKAIYIDTGHITKRPDLNVEEQMQREFNYRLKPLREWIRFKYPQLLSYYDTRKEEIMKEASLVFIAEHS